MCLPWNPALRWVVYRIPLAEMLAANVRTHANTHARMPAHHHMQAQSQSSRTHSRILSRQNIDYPNASTEQQQPPAKVRSYDDHFIKALTWVPLRQAEVTALAAVTQSCLGPLERGAAWAMPSRVNASHRQTLSFGGVYVDRIDFHSLRHLARHGGGGGGGGGGNASHHGVHGHGHSAEAEHEEQASPETDDEVIDRNLRVGTNWAGAVS